MSTQRERDTSEAIDRDSERSMEILEEFAEAQGKMVIKPGALGYIPGDDLRQPQDSHVRAWKEKQRLLGLCVSCPEPAVKGRVSCRRHLAAMRAVSGRTYREKQAFRREHGLCLHCGEVAAEDGYRSCRPCRERTTRANYQRYSPYADRRSA
jgi:hypothetical protein